MNFKFLIKEPHFETSKKQALEKAIKCLQNINDCSYFIITLEVVHNNDLNQDLIAKTIDVLGDAFMKHPHIIYKLNDNTIWALNLNSWGFKIAVTILHKLPEAFIRLIPYLSLNSLKRVLEVFPELLKLLNYNVVNNLLDYEFLSKLTMQHPDIIQWLPDSSTGKVLLAVANKPDVLNYLPPAAINVEVLSLALEKKPEYLHQEWFMNIFDKTYMNNQQREQLYYTAMTRDIRSWNWLKYTTTIFSNIQAGDINHMLVLAFINTPYEVLSSFDFTEALTSQKLPPTSYWGVEIVIQLISKAPKALCHISYAYIYCHRIKLARILSISWCNKNNIYKLFESVVSHIICELEMDLEQNERESKEDALLDLLCSRVGLTVKYFDRNQEFLCHPARYKFFTPFLLWRPIIKTNLNQKTPYQIAPFLLWKPLIKKSHRRPTEPTEPTEPVFDFLDPHITTQVIYRTENYKALEFMPQFDAISSEFRSKLTDLRFLP